MCSSLRKVTGSEMEGGETNTYGLPHMGWAATFTMLSLTLPSGRHHLLCSHVFFHSLSEVSSLAQRHTASQWQSQYPNSGFIPRPFSFSCSEIGKFKILKRMEVNPTNFSSPRFFPLMFVRGKVPCIRSVEIEENGHMPRIGFWLGSEG